MFNIKKIRKQTLKSRIKTIKKYIKWSVEQGEDHTEIIFKDLFYKKDVCVFTDVYVLDYLKSKGFKIKQDDDKLIISWKE